MKGIGLAIVLASSAGLAACATYPAAVAQNNVCTGYGYVDINNDGMISGDEWNSYRTGAYSYWDTNRDGRIERSEFDNCWRAGGFFATLPTARPMEASIGRPSTPTATAGSAPTNIGRRTPGRGSIATITGSWIPTNGTGGTCNPPKRWKAPSRVRARGGVRRSDRLVRCNAGDASFKGAPNPSASVSFDRQDLPLGHPTAGGRPAR